MGRKLTNPADHLFVVLTREHDELERRKLVIKCHGAIILLGLVTGVTLTACGVSPVICGVFAFTPNLVQELFDFIGKL